MYVCYSVIYIDVCLNSQYIAIYLKYATLISNKIVAGAYTVSVFYYLRVFFD